MNPATGRASSSLRRSSPDLERSTLRKIGRRFVPVLFICFVVNFLDRVNVGFAALTMNADLGLSTTEFGLGAGLFFLTYFLLEVPSNLALERFGARRWIARIMLTWAIVSGATAFIRGAYSFYAVRLLLGAAEAGFFPGIVFYLTLWVPPAHRARIAAWFMAAIPVANMIGAPVSGLLLQVDGAAGLKGWQWMFLIEAVPSLVMGLVVLAVLDDKPDDAAWLTPAERAWLKAHTDGESARTGATDRPAFSALIRNRAVLLLGAAYFGVTGYNYGLSFFLPQIIKQMGLTIVQTGFVTAIPFTVAMVGMIVWGRRSDRVAERRFHVLVPLAIASASLAASTVVAHPGAKIALLCLTAFGMFSALPVFWTIPPSVLTPATAAAGIALINSLGNLAGFVDPYAVGAIKDMTGSFAGGLLVVSAFGVVSLLILRRRTTLNVK